MSKRSIPEPVRDASTGCLLWQGCRNRRGYGFRWFRDRNMTAHRASWIEAYGAIPEGMFVCHTCDVKHCIEPSHLFLGTGKDNMADCVRKGRIATGERVGNAKLTRGQVVAMRDEWHSRNVTKMYLARKYGVSHRNVRFILAGATWR